MIIVVFENEPFAEDTEVTGWIEVKLCPTGNLFKKGHRIRVDSTSSNFPRFDVNLNTGEPLNEHRRVQTAVNTIRHDQEYPSYIVLPVIPR